MSGRVPRNPTDLPGWARRQAGDFRLPLSKSMFDIAVRIVGEKKSTGNVIGKKRGTIGTGFVIEVPSEAIVDLAYVYLFTAHHVLDEQGSPQAQASNPFAPGTVYPPFALDDWYQPLEGVDLALSFISDNEDGGVQVIQGLSVLDLMPPMNVPSLGAVVHYIGYLEPLDRMMVRSGAIGALEQIAVEHEEPEYDYDCHLVDCRSYGGFSGSPVIYPQPHPSLTKFDRSKLLGRVTEIVPPVGSMVYIPVLCGMFTQHLDDIYPPEDGTVSRYGVGIMLPSAHIWRALMTDDEVKRRRDLDEENKANASESGAKLRNASVDTDDEFARFEQLTKQLANMKKPGQKDDGE
jgi:hypothetical protein